MTDMFRNRIAIIGWGSLIWDPDNLAPHVTGPWAMGAGPALPLEFARVSPKRRMGLAVCIAPEVGRPCPSHGILSVRDDIAAARRDLAARERAPLDRIGALARGADPAGPRAAVFAAWLKQTGAAGVVWTDFGPNFHETTGRPFTPAHGAAYLRTLTGDSLEEAVRYIDNAPAATRTPLRDHLEAQDWWRDQADRVRRLDAQTDSNAR